MANQPYWENSIDITARLRQTTMKSAQLEENIKCQYAFKKIKASYAVL